MAFAEAENSALAEEQANRNAVSNANAQLAADYLLTLGPSEREAFQIRLGTSSNLVAGELNMQEAMKNTTNHLSNSNLLVLLPARPLRMLPHLLTRALLLLHLPTQIQEFAGVRNHSPTTELGAKENMFALLVA